MNFPLTTHIFGPIHKNAACEFSQSDREALKRIEKSYVEWSTTNKKRGKTSEKIGGLQVKIFFEQSKWVYGFLGSFIPTSSRPNTINVIPDDPRIRCTFKSFFPKSSANEEFRVCPNYPRAEEFQLRLFHTKNAFLEKTSSEPGFFFPGSTSTNSLKREECFLP